MTRLSSTDHPLKQCWPAFLDLLETDAALAAREFADYAYRVLATRTPRSLRDRSRDERDDAIQEIIVHFIEGDCRVLRSYQNTGRPFTSWFLTVANNRVWDLFRKSATREELTVSGDSISGGSGILDFVEDPNASPEDQRTQRRALEAVRRLLGQLSRKCQILVRSAAEEYTPQEMIMLAGLTGMTNKQVSDDLRACRNRLLALLLEEGIVLETAGL